MRDLLAAEVVDILLWNAKYVARLGIS